MNDEETVIDITDEKQVIPKNKRPVLKSLRFDPFVFAQMIIAFATARPNEAIIWLTGVIENGVGHVLKAWDTKLAHANPVSAKTDSEWMAKFPRELAEGYPDHSLVIEAHIHPLGEDLSGTDRAALMSITNWSDDKCFCLLACDLPIGVYTIQSDKIEKLSWEVKGWSGGMTPTTTTDSSLVKRVLRRLRAE